MSLTGATAVRVVGTVSGSVTEVTPTTIHSLANVQDVYIVNTTAIPINITQYGVLEGVPMYYYGNSYPSTGGSGANARFPGRLATRFGTSATLRNVASERITQMVGHFLTTASAWTVGATGVVVIAMMVTDVLYFGDSAHDAAEYQEALRTALRVVRATEKREPTHASVVRSGFASTEINTSMYTGNAIHFTATPGEYADITFSGTEFTFVSRREDNDTPGGTIEFLYPSNSSTVIGELSCDNGFSAGVGVGSPFSMVSKRFSGFTLTASGNTVRARKKAGDANPVYFDCWLNTTGSPPHVFVLQDGDLGIYGGLGSDAAMARFRAAIAEVVSEPEFSWYVTAVDIQNGGWNASTMLGDLIHPNDRGHALIADLIGQKIYDRLPTFSGGVNTL